MRQREILRHRLERHKAPSVSGREQAWTYADKPAPKDDSVVDCGWGMNWAEAH